MEYQLQILQLIMFWTIGSLNTILDLRTKVIAEQVVPIILHAKTSSQGDYFRFSQPQELIIRDAFDLMGNNTRAVTIISITQI